MLENDASSHRKWQGGEGTELNLVFTWCIKKMFGFLEQVWQKLLIDICALTFIPCGLLCSFYVTSRMKVRNVHELFAINCRNF